MLVVPVKGDKVRTKDSGEVRLVSSYSSLKDEPAVYVKPVSIDGETYIYFSDVTEINEVRVEYEPDSKVFKALGPLRRKFNLPQPKDSIKVKLISAPYNAETEILQVTSLRLHSKKFGEERGLLVITKEGRFSIGEIIDIDRADLSERFNVDGFRRFYFDYLPVGIKVKK